MWDVYLHDFFYVYVNCVIWLLFMDVLLSDVTDVIDKDGELARKHMRGCRMCGRSMCKRESV